METKLTQEQVVLRGTQALQLLNDQSFMSFVDEMLQDRLTCIGATQPGDPKARDVLYYEYRGLKDIIDHLTQYAQVAKQIIESEASIVTLDDDDNELEPTNG